MDREHVNAIISLSRTDDWKKFVDYVEGAVREMEYNLGFIDPTNAIEIAKMQGARTALMNMLRLEEIAHQENEEAS